MKIDFSPLSPADGNGLKTVVLSRFLETLGDVHRYYMRFEARSARVWILAECLGYPWPSAGRFWPNAGTAS